MMAPFETDFSPCVIIWVSVQAGSVGESVVDNQDLVVVQRGVELCVNPPPNAAIPCHLVVGKRGTVDQCLLVGGISHQAPG